MISPQAIALKPEGIRYYADTVIQSKIFQLIRRDDPGRYLHLITFIAHEDYRLQDNLVDTLLVSLRSFHNGVVRERKEQCYALREQLHESLKAVLGGLEQGLVGTLATIKLKEVTASDLFRRLNSYPKQHALYPALKAFGQIPKSLFILHYIDDPVLRQAIEKQMDRIEHVHRFTRAVSMGNPREFLQAEKEDQEMEEACKRLLKNCIICWNDLYLSQKQGGDQRHRRPGGISGCRGPWLGGCQAAPQPAGRV